jgi:hypothetical protein
VLFDKPPVPQRLQTMSKNTTSIHHADKSTTTNATIVQGGLDLGSISYTEIPK